MSGKCELCKRDVQTLYGHHLVPRKFLRSKIPKQYIMKYQDDPNRKAKLCVDCNKIVHALHKLKELAKQYDTMEKLRKSPKIQAYVKWVRTRPVGVVTHPRRAWEGGKYE